MTPPKPCFPQLMVWSATLALAGSCAPSLGQSLALSDPGPVDARVDDRVEGLLEVEPSSEVFEAASVSTGQAGEEKDGGWDLGLAISAAYDDNIFLSANDPESDLVVRITPRIAYVLGNDESENGMYVRFDYQPTGVVFADNRSENRTDHDLVLAAGTRGKRMEVDFLGEYRRLGDAIADTGAQTDRREYAAEIRAAYSISEKVALELAAGAYGTDYDESSLSGSRDRFVEAGVRYAYSPKTQVALVYRVGTAEVDGTGDQTFHRVTAKMAWQPRQKISIDLDLGVEHRDFDRGSDTYPVFEFRAAWEAREGTEFYLGGYRREEVSAFFTGQNIRLTGAVVGLSQRFNDAWVGQLEAGYEKASYSRVSGIGPAGREDDIFFIRPALVYEVTEQFSASLYYQYSKDASNDSAFGYTNHQFGVSAAYDF